jgi:hypothetical protein
MDSRGSLERRLGSVHGKFVSRSLVQLSSCTPAEALWSCWQTLTGLVGEHLQNRLGRGPKEAGRCSRGRVCPAARESGYDSIRERVALGLLADGRPSAVGLSFGLKGFCQRFASNGYLLCLRLKHKLPRCFPACESCRLRQEHVSLLPRKDRVDLIHRM